jgi:hypothetical protein
VATYVDSVEFSDEQRYAEAVLDTFDMLAPTFDNPLDPARAARILSNMRISDPEWISRVPLIVRGEVP